MSTHPYLGQGRNNTIFHPYLLVITFFEITLFTVFSSVTNQSIFEHSHAEGGVDVTYSIQWDYSKNRLPIINVSSGLLVHCKLFLYCSYFGVFSSSLDKPPGAI